ncbi:hypothetical protein GN244_ATG03929 [Phytophthora infestans]|uniref:Uncharacterized protein n=1 Tax=Phytophthora infestans TaxID=4787 RepID=A0A833TNC3_PHYIN|nr:hypothetical protein GN244_ATG03929 [Phytophthora infestans]KAF4150138.1 hypothetical protein GN958_ATG00764 [Phytophthora infestans]
MEHTQWTAPAQERRVLKRHEAAAQQRVLQLEQARQTHQISPDAYHHQLHLSSFSYLANVMALRRQKLQAQPQFQRSMY